MAAKPSDFDVQLERLHEKEKIARVNNDHPASVIILKDIVTPTTFRLHYATRHNSGTLSMNRLPSLWTVEDSPKRHRSKWYNSPWLGYPTLNSLNALVWSKPFAMSVLKKYFWKLSMHVVWCWSWRGSRTKMTYSKQLKFFSRYRYRLMVQWTRDRN